MRLVLALPQIRDVRRLHPSDELRRSAYPLQLLPARSDAGALRAARRCDVCASNPASTVAYADPLGPANPSFYCSRCVAMLHPGGRWPSSAKHFPYVLHGAAAEGGARA
jgi:hypothetical protein